MRLTATAQTPSQTRTHAHVLLSGTSGLYILLHADVRNSKSRFPIHDDVDATHTRAYMRMQLSLNVKAVPRLYQRHAVRV